MGCRRSAPILAGVEVGGFGLHSFRRGSAVALFHSGADRVAVTDALRCRSLSPSRPYITDAARMGAAPELTPSSSACCLLRRCPSRFLLLDGDLCRKREARSRFHAGSVGSRGCPPPLTAHGPPC